MAEENKPKTVSREDPGAPTTRPHYSKPPRSDEVLLSGDQMIRGGQQIGRSQAQALYGMNQQQVGDSISDVYNMRKAMVNQTDPVSSKIREGRNEQIRSLRAQQGARGIQGGVAAGQEAQVGRMAQNDISNQLFRNQQQSLGQYQKLLGNIASNQSGLEMGWAGLEKSGEYVPPGSYGRHSGSSLDGFMESISPGNTVICTELYNQGMMTENMLELDKAYGSHIRKTNPNVYIGYYVWAVHVVKLMKKSRKFTKLVSFFAKPWARNMAYNDSLFGKIISEIGEPICGFIGYFIRGSYEEIKR